MQRRNAVLDEELLSGVGSSTNDLPICTVIFEIVDLWTVWEKPMHEMVLVLRHRVPVEAPDRLRVVYDRRYPCSDTSYSVTTFLQSNHSFDYQAVWDYARDQPTSLTSTIRVPAHSIRILPIHDSRPPFPGLPPELLRQIISEAILTTGSDVDWRSDLLSYGMVCKSWVHVLNLFYAFYCRKHDPPTAVSVAKWLQCKPQNAKLIRRFNPSDYRDTNPDISEAEDMEEDEYIQSCEALLDILELSTQIREIEITAIAESLLQRQIHALHQLREVRTCKITGDDPSRYYPEMPKRLCVTLDDVHSFIVHWPNLLYLDIDYCDAREPEDKTTG